MGKIKTGSYNPLPILPIVLVGANVNGKPNYMPIGFVGGVDNTPPIIMISSTPHYTLNGIMENGTFSINIPSADLVLETDYCGLVTGKTTDKSEIFSTFYGELETAPMIEECPIVCECKYLDRVKLAKGIHTQYYGIVHQVYVNDNLRTDKNDILSLINPVLLSSGEYRTIGKSESLGKSFRIGWNYKGAKHRGPKSFVRGPQYVEKEEFQVIGIEDIGKEQNRDLLQLWARYRENIREIPNRDRSYSLGIKMFTNEMSEKGENRMVVGNAISKVDDIPKGLVLVTIPAQKYAIFTHIGRYESFIYRTIQYIYGEWLPNNKKYERVPLAPEFAWYDRRFEQDSDNAEFDYYIPVQEKLSG
ncbi:MAG: effector binding domain-containing protein [Promethearchaeota archaeon]|jgi:predicted transcriptional regulator YdeE/flavin reductase (DIM6/NTAB) family NADH-FMN oxidoreductase RutF